MIRQERKAALGDRVNTFQLYEDLTGLDKTLIIELSEKYPKLLGCTPMKVEFMKYIQFHIYQIKIKRNSIYQQIRRIAEFVLHQTPFTKTDLAATPWIFYQGLKKLKQRMYEMKTIGITPNNINILSYSTENFEEIVEQMRNEKDRKKMNTSEKVMLAELIQDMFPSSKDFDVAKISAGLPDSDKVSFDSIMFNVNLLIQQKATTKNISLFLMLLQQTGSKIH